MIYQFSRKIKRSIPFFRREISNPKKAFCFVLLFALIAMVHLYVQEKDSRIAELQNELR